MARAVSADGLQVGERDGVLLLDSGPLTAAVARQVGDWFLQIGGDVQLLSSGIQRLQVGATQWVVDLPETVPQTDPLTRPLPSALLWTFRGRTLTARLGSRVVWTAQSAELSLLRFLAEVWFADERPARERGWVTRRDAAVELAIAMSTVDVMICRIRHAARLHGIVRPNEVVQVRRGTGLIRFGGRRVIVRD